MSERENPIKLNSKLIARNNMEKKEEIDNDLVHVGHKLKIRIANEI
jgi:hypothetical protein